MSNRKTSSRVLSLVLALVMVITMMPQMAFAAEKAGTFKFGTAQTELAPGKYDLPLEMNKAGKEDDPSMASSCIKGATLLVGEDGTGKVTINLGAVSVGGISGWGSEWNIYPELANYKDWTKTSPLKACEFTTNKEGEADSITFTVPNNLWDGVYSKMYIGVMDTYQDAYFKIDYATAAPHVEPVPVNFSSGNNGKIIATVKNREIKSGDLVKVGEEVLFTAKPDTGYTVDKWTGIEGSGNSVKAKVKEALNVNVTFKEKILQKYAVVFNAGQNGTLSATVNGKEIKSGDMIEENSSVIFTAKPNEGYYTEWIGVVGNDNTATAVVTNALNIKANFLQILDRKNLDEAIAAADTIVANKADYADDESWAKFETKLKYAKEHKFTSQDLVDSTAELLTMYQSKLTKLNVEEFKAAWNKIDIKQNEVQNGYPLEHMIAVRGPWFEAYDYVVPADKKRVKSQQELDAITARVNAGIKAYEDYQANAKDLASVVKTDGTVTNYKSLRGAVDAATTGDTVKLLGDLTTATQLNRAKDLDLNGFTLTNKTYKTEKYIFNAYNEISPKNGTLNVDELKLKNEITLSTGLTVNGLIKARKKVTVDGAILNAPKDSDLFGFHSSIGSLPEIVVNSGTLNAPDGYAIKPFIDRFGKITNITVNGGTLIGNEYAIKGIKDVKVNGGEFKAVKGAVLGGKVVTPEGKKLSTVADKNGFFKLINSDVVENTEMVISVDSKKYATAEEAFKNITEGATVKLLADAEVTDYAEITKSCTIDLNGHRLRIHPFNHDYKHDMGKGGVWCTLKILEGAKVDVVDKSILKTGILAQTGASKDDTGILAYGELTATDIKCDNQNTVGEGSLIIPYKVGKAKVTLDNVKLADGNRSVIVGGGAESGDVFIKNITETFDSQYDAILCAEKLGNNTYTIENCNFTDAGSKRAFPDNLTIRNTVWNFTNGGKIEASSYKNTCQAIFENATITTANTEEAVYVSMHEKAVFKDCMIKNTEGYAVTLNNELYKPYTIESGTYEGKDYAINSDPFFYVTGGQFKGAKGGAKGILGCPEGKELKLSSNGYYTLQNGEGFKFAPANGKDVAIYAENGELLGGANLDSDDILMAPNHAKLILQKDIVVDKYAKLTMLYGGELTLDLNGHNISFGNDSAYISIYNGTGVTLIDSKDKGVINLIPQDADYAGQYLKVESDEGTYLTIAGGYWDVMLLVSGTAGDINIIGGHFDVAIQTGVSEEPMLLKNATATKVTGGDFSYDVSQERTAIVGFENGQWVYDVVCDPVPHDTHATYEKDGRWYVVEKANMPAPKTPVIAPESKNFKEGETVEVSITGIDKNAKVYYTLDGTKPTSKSTEYTKPFTVDKTTKVTAVAIRDSKVSEFAEATYTMKSIKTATAPVAFSGNEAYRVTANVTVIGDKITDVTLSHDAADKNHVDSVTYADKAKAMADKFKNLVSTDKRSIKTLDGVTGATVTAEAYKTAVLEALGLNTPADLTFGTKNTELKPGTYDVPISLRHSVKHDNESAAVTAFPLVGKLIIDKYGFATLETTLNAVEKAGLVDMAQNIKVYQEDNCNVGTKTVPVTELEKLTNPEGIYKPDASVDKIVPSKISFDIPNNDWDGVYMNLWVDAMHDAPDAWLNIDYAKAAKEGDGVHYKGSAKVNQFGKYTIHTDVTVKDGVISNVDVTADTFISETHRPTNEMKIAQVTTALKSIWNGMAPTKENAEAIFKKIMKADSPESVIDGISGATYSGKAVRDAVMDAFKLEYQDEVINVPKSVEPGIYEVDIEYASDVVWHSLVENAKTKATLTVNRDKTMSLEFDTKSGTEKEPLYILGFNGIYPDNDRTQKLTKDGCEVQMGLSSNDYEDENFVKGTQVVNHVKFPLVGGLQKVYNTNAYLYVPAMKKLNGELSGVFFENGKFNVDIFAKIFWDGMTKIGDVPGGDIPGGDIPSTEKYNVDGTMLHESKDQASMCDIMFDKNVEVSINGDSATLKLLVANPVPGFPNEGADGTVKNVVVNYNGQQYTAESKLGTDAMMTAKDTNSVFGFEKGQQYKAQVLTVTLPKAAVKEGALLNVSAYVNVVMNTDVNFRLKLTNVPDFSGGGGGVTPVPPVEPETVVPEVVKPILPVEPPKTGADLGMDKEQQVEADKTIGEIITDIVNPTVKPEPPKTEAEKETAATEEKISEAVKNNDKIKVNVETEKVDEEKAPEAIKKEITDIKDKVNEIYSEVGGKLLQFADITVTAQAVKEDGTIVDLGKLKNLDKKLSFTFQLPEKTEGDKFGVIRYHDGKAEVIPASDVKYDPVTKKITFLTDKFSTYAVFKYDKEPEVTPVPPVRPAKVENLKIRTDYGLLKVTFDKSKEDVELYRIAVRKHGDKAWKYYETKNNSLIIKKLNGKALVKSARYDVMVAAVRDKAENIRSYYTKVKTVYANKSGVKAYKMYSPKFESIKRYNSGKTKVVVRNVKYTGETYQVAFRVKGTKTWKNTHYSTKTVRYITGLKKGKTYQFKVNYRYKSKLDGKTYVYSNSVYKYAKIR